MAKSSFHGASDQITDLMAAGIPLESGLRALAEELGGVSNRQLNAIADQVARGVSLEKILDNTDAAKPRFVVAALQAAIETGDPGSVVVELAEYENRRRQLFRGFWASVAYPFVMLLFVILLMVLASTFITPSISRLANEFEVSENGTLRTLEWLASYGLVYAGWWAAGTAVYVMGSRLLLGKARWRWLLASMPIVGPISFWSGAWEFSVRLRLLLERHVPLSRALRIVADTCSDPNFADVALRLAKGVDSGRSLHEQMSGSTRVPATLSVLVGWGETDGQLPKCMALSANVFQQRLQLRLDYLTGILPPIIFVAIAGLAIFAAAFCVNPLVQLVQFLSTFAGPTGGQGAVQMPGVTTLGLTLVGVALWWTIHVVFLTRRQSPDSRLIFGLRVTAIVMIFFGLAHATLTVGFPISLLAVLALFIVWAMAVNRFRKSETRSFLFLLGLARENGLPIITAAKAFADERTDEIGLRAGRVVESLERGVPFAKAMVSARLPATTESLFAIAFGVGRTDAVEGLQNSSSTQTAPDDVIWGLFQRLMYLCFLPVFGIFVWTFLCLKIWPSFAQIFEDFELEIPTFTQHVLRLTETVTSGGILTFLVYFVCVTSVCLLLTAMLVIQLYYTGWLRWEPPFLRRLTVTYHGSIILRTIAGALESRRNIPATLSEITIAYPTYYIRQRLISVVDRIEQGQQWIGALQADKLISNSTAAVLYSAERAGNLPWAMREMADASMRRLLLRMNAFVQIATPFLLIAIAAPIAVATISIFLPLCSLIVSLA